MSLVGSIPESGNREPEPVHTEGSPTAWASIPDYRTKGGQDSPRAGSTAAPVLDGVRAPSGGQIPQGASSFPRTTAELLSLPRHRGFGVSDTGEGCLT